MIIGRKNEREELLRLYESGKAEFVALYGRRRVGKTYLINEVFKDKFTFYHSGLSPLEREDSKKQMATQLEYFYYSLISHGVNIEKVPKNWLEAFFLLQQFLNTKSSDERCLLFFDELPWMDTPHSGFITALEAFWNGWACRRSNVMLIVCGSASSWILDNLINNHGGLYNRVTYEINLSPFSLKECEEYFLANGFHFSRYDIVQSYMIFGGVPYYLGYLNKAQSLAKNIDRIFFSKGAKLKDEFERLFASAFDSSEKIKAIVKSLSLRNAGLTRREISENTGIGEGGNLTNMLRALIASGFIIQYVPFGLSKRQVHYKLTDPFCLFYLQFIEGKDSLSVDFWRSNVTSQSVVSWRGLAFENVCFNHIEQIKRALGISGIGTKQSAWSKRADDTEGTQIDLLIERNDNAINMCEIKFYSYSFTVTKDYYLTLMKRLDILSTLAPKKASIFNTLITTYGLDRSQYSSVFTNVIVLDDLFA